MSRLEVGHYLVEIPTSQAKKRRFVGVLVKERMAKTMGGKCCSSFDVQRGEGRAMGWVSLDCGLCGLASRAFYSRFTVGTAVQRSNRLERCES